MALRQLHSQAALAESGTLVDGHRDLQFFATTAGPSFGSISALAKQVRCEMPLVSTHKCRLIYGTKWSPGTQNGSP